MLSAHADSGPACKQLNGGLMLYNTVNLAKCQHAIQPYNTLNVTKCQHAVQPWQLLLVRTAQNQHTYASALWVLLACHAHTNEGPCRCVMSLGLAFQSSNDHILLRACLPRCLPTSPI